MFPVGSFAKRSRQTSLISISYSGCLHSVVLSPVCSSRWYFLRAGKYALIFVYVQSLKSWTIQPIKAMKKRGSAGASFVRGALQATFLLRY